MPSLRIAPQVVSPVLCRIGTMTSEENILAGIWAADSSALAVASYQGEVCLLQRQRAWEIRSLLRHQGPVSCLAMHPSRSLLASGGDDGHVKLIDWNLDERPTLVDLHERLQDDWVQVLAWSSGGEYLAAACGPRVYLLDATGQILQVWRGFSSTLHGLAWHPSLPLLLVASDGGLSQLKPGDTEIYSSFPTDSAAMSLSISPDARFLVSGNLDTSMNIWVEGEEEPYRMQGYRGKPRLLAWSRHAASRLNLAVASGGDVIVLWNFTDGAPDGQRPLLLERHKGPVRALVFLKSRPWLLSCAEDGRLIIWQETRNWKSGTIDQPGGALVGLCASPDELQLAVWTRDAQLHLYGLTGVQ